MDVSMLTNIRPIEVNHNALPHPDRDETPGAQERAQAPDEQCTEDEWRKILANLEQEAQLEATEPATSIYDDMSPTQQNQVCRLLACVLRASNQDFSKEWGRLRPQLETIGMDESMLGGIEAAARVSMPMDLLVQDLEPEVASFALSKAINIALLDRQITQAEDDALNTLLRALKQQSSISP
jgi:hypothetical protein